MPSLQLQPLLRSERYVCESFRSNNGNVHLITPYCDSPRIHSHFVYRACLCQVFNAHEHTANVFNFRTSAKCIQGHKAVYIPQNSSSMQTCQEKEILPLNRLVQQQFSASFLMCCNKVALSPHHSWGEVNRNAYHTSRSLKLLCRLTMENELLQSKIPCFC